MKNTERTLFFSMTYEFLEVYMPTLATLLSVITRMGRRVLAHLHSAGTFAPAQERTYNPDGQEGLGAPSFGWDFRPRSGTYLMNVYSVVK